MRQLTGLDAQFLALESPRQAGHVGAVAVLDPSSRPNGQLELADIQNMIAERLPLLPPFRWRLKPVPLGLDYPYWIDDLDFDLEYHVRELAATLPNIEDVAVLAQIPGAKLVGRTTATAARLLRGGEHRVLERSALEPPRTEFNGHVSPHRRFSFGQLSLADVKAVKNAH